MNDDDLERLADRLAEKLEARRQCAAPRLMDIGETARYMGRTLDGVKSMVKRGTIPVTKIDGKVQVDRMLLDQLIRARTA